MPKQPKFLSSAYMERACFVDLLREHGGPIPPDRVKIRHEEDDVLHYFAFHDTLWGPSRILGFTCPKISP